VAADHLSRHVDNETFIALSFQLVATTSGSRRYESDMVGVARPGPTERPPAVVRHLGADDRTSQRIRIVDATLACIATQGVSKTVLDDIAEAAGLSRATVYRAFPGGRDAIFAATVETELARLFSHLAISLGEATDLEEVLVVGMVETARSLLANRAIGYLLDHEPAVLLSHLCFDRMERVYAVASSFAAPFLARWLEPDQAARAAEWAVRITFSYLGEPGSIDPTDRDDVARLVSRFVLPGVLALRTPETARPRSKPSNHRQ
jgi:AcrR family transcriptional regulator